MKHLALVLSFVSLNHAFPSFWTERSEPASYGSMSPNPANGHWVDTWTAMPQLTEFENLPQPPFNQTTLTFPNSTIRQTLRMTIDAEQIRVRFTNAFGLNDLPITKATIALPRAEKGQNVTGSSGIQTETLQTLTFSGNESITIPDGALAVSDPINFPIKTGQVISISMYLKDGQKSQYITSHPGSRVVIWFSFGDYTTSPNMTDPSTNQTQHWYFLDAVEAWKSPQYRAFAVVGDSITDGRSSYVNTNTQWPNLLFNQLQKSSSESLKSISVVNQAAGGNRVLYDGLGPNTVSRIDRDVIAQSGVKYAMIFEGVNDIGEAAPTVENQTLTGDRLIQAYKQIITRVHTFNIPMFGATITPFGCPNVTLQPYALPIREQTRNRVNEWIRTSGWFDAVIDFDAMLRDPSNHTQLAPYYDSGDCLHPNPAGYHEIARKFPLEIFEKFKNGVSTFM
jgi:lysophospholipase L1-like esterase